MRKVPLNLDRQTYSELAKVAMAIVRDLEDYVMAAYRLPNDKGCVLDLFFRDRCLSIRINNEASSVELLLSGLDSGDPPFCICCVHKSHKAWRQLLELAIAHRE